ncbi:hypothetical protein T4D_12535 [Trichinella pseudospiralis]|uniref:Uncharacterized protein n=1 Tax=Trichinella pseudospiralis TaxID=6337 RepID=A0A0V1DNK7_TRIPS|nr:hypothetical protein T4D_12535 [Trichinella pseudospiralis]
MTSKHHISATFDETLIFGLSVALMVIAEALLIKETAFIKV